MRVWWRGPADNRVDVVTPAGETGTHRGPGGDLDVGVRDGDGDPQRRQPAGAARPAGRAAQLARPPAAVRGRRRRALPARRPAGGRPRRPRAAPDARRPRPPRCAASTSGSTPAPGCRCRSRSSRRAPASPALDTRFLDLDLAVPGRGGHRLHPAARRRRPRGTRGRGGARGRPADPAGAAPGRARRAAPTPRWTACPRDRALRQRGHPAGRRPGAGAAWPRGLRNALSAQPGRRRRRRWAPGWPPARWRVMIVEPPGRGPVRAHRHGDPRRARRRRRRQLPDLERTP